MQDMNLSDEDQKIIARTRQARERAGLEQESVAKKIGCGRTTYTRYENDRVIPMRRREKFCEATGTSEKWLSRGIGQMERDDWEQRDIDFIRQLNDQQLDELEQFAKFRFPEQFKKDPKK